ncbi:uncharacterized protein LOC131803224 [Musca domestica]|uniref:Uncharacterized protein LOC131803224 n=1 Tax=Musca domestica TaxID=7370 RepID=A0ABM3V3E6_MUSDO|nr:uncharacterized protein LOC131803224 [Musca domestica]
MIAQYVGGNHRHWDQHLPEIAFAVNTSVHESTKSAAAEILFGRNLANSGTNYTEHPMFSPLGGDNWKEIWKKAKENNEKSSERQRHHYSLRRKKWTPPIRFLVWRRERPQSSAVEKFTHKLAEKFSGPYTVTGIIHGNIVEIIDDKERKIKVHIQDLKNVYQI